MSDPSMTPMTAAERVAHQTRVKQLSIQFGGAARRYMDAAERGDVREMLSQGLQVQQAMERVAKAVTRTEVLT